jgi:hypothetical protein
MPEVSERLPALVLESNEVSLGTLDSDAEVLTEATHALFSSWLSSRPPSASSMEPAVESVHAGTSDSSGIVSRLGFVRKPEVKG